MNYRMMLIIGIGALAPIACIPVQKKPVPTGPVAPKIYFDGKTNADLLIDSIQALPLPELGMYKVRENTPIMVGSMEQLADSEVTNHARMNPDPIIVMVEDGLVKKLSGSGYRVVERDMDILTRLYHESQKEYLVSIGPNLHPNQMYREFLSHLKDEKSISGASAEGSGEQKASVSDNYVAKVMVDTFFPHFVFTNEPYLRHPFNGDQPLQKSLKLQSAGFILSFRVLECGVTYRPISERLHDSYSQVERIAITKLHVRLVDAKTGVVHWSDIITGKVKEKTAESLLPFAEHTDYKFYGFSSPAKTFLDKKREADQKQREESNPQKGKWSPLNFLK